MATPNYAFEKRKKELAKKQKKQQKQQQKLTTQSEPGRDEIPLPLNNESKRSHN